MIKVLIGIILVPILLALTSAAYITTDGNTLHKLAKYFSSKYLTELEMDFDKINIKIDPSSITQRELLLESREQCVKYSPIDICIKKLLLKVDFDLLSPMDFTVEKADIRLSKVKIGKLPSKQDDSSTIDIYQMYYDIYSLYRGNISKAPKVFHIEAQNVELENDTQLNFLVNTTSIKLNLSKENLHANIDLKNIESSVFSGTSRVSTDKLRVEAATSLELKEIISLELKNDINFSEKDIQASLSLKLSENLNLDIGHTTVQLPQASIKIKTCSFMLSDSQTHAFNCPFIFVNVDKDPLLELKFNALLKNLIDTNKTDNALSFNISTKESQSDLFTLDLKASAAVDIKDASPKPRLDSFRWLLEFNNFQKLVERLKNTSFAIFAPFNTMDGKVLLKSQKVFDINNDGYTIPLTAKIDLKDKKKNALNFNFDGKLHTSKNTKPKILGSLVIEQARINIPNIDPIGGIPKIGGSSRINKEIETKRVESKELPLTYKIKVSSKSNESIKLYYYLLDPYLAFGVNASISNDNTQIKIKSNKKVTISYLKRNLDLNSFLITSKQDQKVEINLLSSYYTSGYRINLKVIGTLEKPKLILSSYPTLPREDIISLLIFKRKSNAISGSQRQSVGGTEAAIADQALGLFSIWAFASTPIEYVAYDSASKSYSASISLPGNTSFKIGTNWETVNALTLRKQLNETWAIETSYNPNDEKESKNVMLQKEINF